MPLEIREQPGAAEVFASLRDRDIRVVLNTGYDRATAEGLLEKLGWRIGDQIDDLVTASDVQGGHPGPDMIHHAMRSRVIRESRRMIKIGDSQVDIDEGRNADCGMTIGITTGAHDRTQLAASGATAIIDRLSDLPAKIGLAG